MSAFVMLGDCRELIPESEDDTIDAVVTDPPYELGFMGKTWDKSGVAFDWNTWAHVLRVIKPGGYVLAFGGTRTFHRLAVAIEDAGFEIRDCLSWIYGSGFPKSLDVSKALDKAAGVEREVVGPRTNADGRVRASEDWASRRYTSEHIQQANTPYALRGLDTAPATDLARQWDGWGTALKPAWEPIIVARKPFRGTVAANVTVWGVGGLNIAATRIGSGEDRISGGGNGLSMPTTYGGYAARPERPKGGRWPANLILDEESAAMLDEMSGESQSPQTYQRNAPGFGTTSYRLGEPAGKLSLNYGDGGGASRFFYCAKASKAERNRGLTEPNKHPTVKPVSLMRWLTRLITPPSGLIFDPFAGSGSTGIAAVLEGFHFVGMDKDPESVETAEARIAHAERNPDQWN